MDQSSWKSNKNQLDDMINTIKQEIFTGRLKPGEFLPSERSLANKFRIGNLTVRKGLEILVSDKLIEKIPRVGNKVVDPTELGIVTVQFAYHQSLIKEAVIEQLIDDFHRIHPHIRIQTFAISSMNYYQMAKELMDRGALDVFTINYNNYCDFVSHSGLDYLEPLDKNLSTYSFLIDQFMQDGQLKVQPFVFSPLILCYNKEHFRENGLGEPDSSWHWNQLFDTADQLAIENERLGFYCQITSLNRWAVFFIQSGVSFQRDEEGKLQASIHEIMDAIDVVRGIVTRINQHPMLLPGAVAEELFFEGKVSMIMTTYMSLNHYKNKEVPFDIAPLPYLHCPITMLQTIGLSVVRNSRVKESAKLFVEYLTSYRAQLLIRQQTLSIPAHKLAAEWNGDEPKYRPSRFNLYRDIIPSFRLYTDLNMTEQQMYEFFSAVRLYWSGLEQEDVLQKRLQRL